MKQISSRSTNHNNFFRNFYWHSIKTWQSRPSLLSFKSMSILVIRSNRWQETVSLPKYGLKWLNCNHYFEGILTFNSWHISFNCNCCWKTVARQFPILFLSFNRNASGWQQPWCSHCLSSSAWVSDPPGGSPCQDEAVIKSWKCGCGGS